MKNTATRKAAVMIAVLGIAVSQVSASEFRAFDRKSQVLGSELILSGRVVRTSSGWTANRSAIYTDAEIAVHEVWKGLPGSDRITVRSLSGTVDDVSLEVEGAARLAEGEEVVLFLDSLDGRLTPWGMRFGKYDVVGSMGEEFLVGSLPPSVTGAQEFVQVSIAMQDLRDEVRSILEGEVE